MHIGWCSRRAVGAHTSFRSFGCVGRRLIACGWGSLGAIRTDCQVQLVPFKETRMPEWMSVTSGHACYMQGRTVNTKSGLA